MKESWAVFFSVSLLSSSLSCTLIDALNLYFYCPASFISPRQIVSLSSLSRFVFVLPLSASAVVSCLKEVLTETQE